MDNAIFATQTNVTGGNKMYNTGNLARFIKHLGWEQSSESLKKIIETLEAMSPTSKKIIEVRWGLLCSSKMCLKYKNLNEKLDVDDSCKLYHEAMREFHNIKYAKMLIDYEELELKCAINLGKLATVIFCRELEEKRIIGTSLIEIINTTLTPRESRVIKLRFGLEEPYDVSKIEEICKQYNVTVERIRQIESKSLRKLRHQSRKRCFDLVEKTKAEERERAKAKEISEVLKHFDGSESIVILDFSVRTYNSLTKYGIETIEDFLKLTEEEVLKIRNIGKRGVEEIATCRTIMGVSLE